MSFAVWNGTTLGGQWGPAQRLRSEANEPIGRQDGDVCLTSWPAGRRVWQAVVEGVEAVSRRPRRSSPIDRSGVVGSIGFVDRLSTMGAVGTPAELQDRRAVDQAVEKRRG